MDFTLDVAKWRSGGQWFNKNTIGKGPTKLLNRKGYMCCLGQFSRQLGCSPNKMRNIADPANLYDEYKKPKRVLEIFVKEDEDSLLSSRTNTDLTNAAISINDNGETTATEKILELKKLFNKYGHSITITNEHILKINCKSS